jgi:hypothetical protein
MPEGVVLRHSAALPHISVPLSPAA